MSIQIIHTNNTVYPVIPEAIVVSQPEKKKHKKSNKKKIVIGSIITLAVVLIIIIIVVAVVLAVLLTRKCRYGRSFLECIECGVIYSSDRIVGGQNVVYNSWPSIVLLQFKYFYSGGSGNTFSVSTLCGGTLVNQDTVITAAHCFNNRLLLNDGSLLSVTPNAFHPNFESMYTVYLGLNDKSDLSAAVSRSVKSFTVHPNYDATNILNDIAIIKLSIKVDLNEKIQVSCLPENSQIYPKYFNINAYVVGWGKTSQAASTTPNILQEALITVYDSSKCNLVGIGTPKNWNNQICAGKYTGGVDTCQGDSGGPLYVKDQVDKKSKFVLAGVTSYGVGCGQFQRPGIYTRVSAYIGWIEKKMNE